MSQNVQSEWATPTELNVNNVVAGQIDAFIRWPRQDAEVLYAWPWGIHRHLVADTMHDSWNAVKWESSAQGDHHVDDRLLPLARDDDVDGGKPPQEFRGHRRGADAPKDDYEVRLLLLEEPRCLHDEWQCVAHAADADDRTGVPGHPSEDRRVRRIRLRALLVVA